jgi:iron complex outermembrane receptor protein
MRALSATRMGYSMIIDREMIELSGESSVADYLRSLSFNSFGHYRSQMGSEGHGTAQASLRKVGSKRSLVLIDGRRPEYF